MAPVTDEAGDEVGAEVEVQADQRVVRVLPDQPAIDKTFDYSVPAAMGDQVRVGTMVRIALHGRRIGGWVVADGVEPPPGVKLRPVAKVTGWGPAADVLDLAEWAAWRWSGRPAQFLRTASPEHAVRHGPSSVPARPIAAPADELVAEAFAHDRSVLRLPPATDTYDVALAAAARGHALILVPSITGARYLGLRLRRAGVTVAVMPRDWALAATGATVVGARAAAWAPVRDLASVVVIDEHDESWQQEQAPTWHARDVGAERARRAGVPCVLVSPTPSLEALDWGRLVAPSRSAEREGWPIVDVVDRRDEDPGRAGLFSDRLVSALRGGGRVLCVLNRKGRARLLACAACGEIAACERCEASVVLVDAGSFACRRCDAVRPPVCLACGGSAFKNLRAGVARVREELEVLAQTTVVEVTAATNADALADARIYVGTEAVLHQVPAAEVVAFLDFDQELLAPRYRAAEEAMALLARAARCVGGRSAGGRVLVQTRLPDHEVIQAAVRADPTVASRAEADRRALLRFPPVSAMAAVSGAAAPAFVASLRSAIAAAPPEQPVVEVLGPSDDVWLVRAPDHTALLDLLRATPRPPGRLRVAVDPLRL